MAQPTPYTPSFSFTDWQTLHPIDPPPGQNLDIEYGNVQSTIGQILANLKLIQRDDTQIANQTIGLAQLKPEVTVGFNAPQTWVTAHSYTLADTVFQTSSFYRCKVAHISGTFSTDLAAGKWELIVDLSTIPIQAASQISFSPTGNIAATDVQTALAEVDSEHALVSHTHTASQISDSTSFGRTLLTAASVAAQQSALGIGAVGLLASVDTAHILAANVTGPLLASSIPCSVVQALYTTNADITGVIPIDDTIPQNTEGTQILSVTTPTPASSSSKFLIHVGGQVCCATSTEFGVAVFRTGTASAIVARSGIPAAGDMSEVDISYIDSPASAAAVTYTVRIGTNAGTVLRMNGTTAARRFGGVAAADLTVIEIR